MSIKVAVIPARGGSKRIPQKNIKMFAGKPMIAHAITAARNSGLFDHVIVTTDSLEIAQIACEWGAETPFVRPVELADDHTPTVPVIAHAIQACVELGWHFDLVCCIYPSAPLIQITDLVGTLAQLQNSKADYSFPITEFPSAIQRALKRGDNGRMVPFYPQYELTRTQDLEPAFHDAGQFYWGTKSAWLTNPHIHRGGVGYAIPIWRVVDIDTPNDWQHAEMIFDSMHRR